MIWQVSCFSSLVMFYIPRELKILCQLFVHLLNSIIEDQLAVVSRGISANILVRKSIKE